MYVWKPPHINNSIFDKSAQRLSARKVSLINDLKTSAPPKKVISPNITAMCINRDFLLSNTIDKSPHKNSGRPRKEGINEVKDWLSLIKLTNIPQISKIIPITAVIFSIIATATFLSVVLTYTQAPQKIISYFTEMGVSVNLFWIMLGAICLILGTFIEIVPVFYLTVPIFAALTLSFNQSLLHLYVVFVAFAGIGMITPPVCVGIYTAAGVIKENPAKAFREVPLFTIVGIIYGILMILFPIFSTWLPGLL